MQPRAHRKTLNGKSCPPFLPIELIGRQWINSLLDQSIRVTQECEVHNGSGKRTAAWENLCVLRMRTDNNIIATISPSSIFSLLWLSIGTSAFLTNFLRARSGSVRGAVAMMCAAYSRQAAGKTSHTREEQFKLLTACTCALGKKSEHTDVLQQWIHTYALIRGEDRIFLRFSWIQISSGMYGIQSRDLIFSRRISRNRCGI